MNLTNVIVGISSILLFMVGVDKFLMFLDPPCSLQDGIPPAVWKVLGVLQIAGGILIWLPKFRRYVVGFFLLFMLFFIGVHLGKGTSDVGGALFMAILMALLVWNPSFIRGK